VCEWICETQCNLGLGCIGTIKFLSLPSSMRTIIQSTESRLAEYFGSVSLFAHVTGETESAHPFLSTHLFRRMSSDREHECERCLCHTTAVTFPTFVTPSCLANFWTRLSRDAIFFFFESAFIFRNKQTSAKTRRAPMGPNVRSVSTGGIWPKVRGVGEVW